MSIYVVTGHALNPNELGGVPLAEVDLLRRVQSQSIGTTITLTLTPTADTAAKAHGILR